MNKHPLQPNWINYLRTFCFIAIASFFTSALADESLFDQNTGLRIHHYTEPVPDEVPGGTTLNTAEVVSLLEKKSVVLIDVISINNIRYDELDGSWANYPERMHIEGSKWLPNVGYGRPADDMLGYLITETLASTSGDFSAPVMIYCISDCWMGWNAVQHLVGAGFTEVYWYPDGTDGWVQAGHPVVPAKPSPVNVD